MPPPVRSAGTNESHQPDSGIRRPCAPSWPAITFIVATGGDSSDLDSWVEAHDPETGDMQWRWNVTPRKGEPGIETWPSQDAAIHGGGGVWQMPTYDPELNLLYVTTGQPIPVFEGHSRPGDNLYTSSIVALNADTGKMTWYFQCTPHDTHDWDATEVPVLIDSTDTSRRDRPRKLLAQANRNGYYFLLDLWCGKNLVTKAFRPGELGEGHQRERQPIPDPEAGAESGRCPGRAPPPMAQPIFPAPVSTPETGLLNVNTIEGYSVYHLEDPAMKPVGFAHSSEYSFAAARSALKAIDYRTGKIKWQHEYPGDGFRFGSFPGVLSTAGRVVFAGDDATNLVAYDAATGKILWHANLGAVVANSPTTYPVDGKQYVLVAAGDTFWAFWLQ